MLEGLSAPPPEDDPGRGTLGRLVADCLIPPKAYLTQINWFGQIALAVFIAFVVLGGTWYGCSYLVSLGRESWMLITAILLPVYLTICLGIMGLVAGSMSRLIAAQAVNLPAPPPAQPWRLGVWVWEGMKVFGLNLIYNYPIVTTPLLPAAWLTYARTQDGRCLNAIAIIGMLRGNWRFSLTAMGIAVGWSLLLHVLVGLETAVLIDLMPDLLDLQVTISIDVPILLCSYLFVVMVTVMLGILMFSRCLGRLAYHRPEVLDRVPQEASPVAAVGSVLAGLVLTAGAVWVQAQWLGPQPRPLTRKEAIQQAVDQERKNVVDLVASAYRDHLNSAGRLPLNHTSALYQHGTMDRLGRIGLRESDFKVQSQVVMSGQSLYMLCPMAKTAITLDGAVVPLDPANPPQRPAGPLVYLSQLQRFRLQGTETTYWQCLLDHARDDEIVTRRLHNAYQILAAYRAVHGQFPPDFKTLAQKHESDGQRLDYQAGRWLAYVPSAQQTASGLLLVRKGAGDSDALGMTPDGQVRPVTPGELAQATATPPAAPPPVVASAPAPPVAPPPTRAAPPPPVQPPPEMLRQDPEVLLRRLIATRDPLDIRQLSAALIALGGSRRIDLTPQDRLDHILPVSSAPYKMTYKTCGMIVCITGITDRYPCGGAYRNDAGKVMLFPNGRQSHGQMLYAQTVGGILERPEKVQVLHEDKVVWERSVPEQCSIQTLTLPQKTHAFLFYHHVPPYVEIIEAATRTVHPLRPPPGVEFPARAEVYPLFVGEDMVVRVRDLDSGREAAWVLAFDGASTLKESQTLPAPRSPGQGQTSPPPRTPSRTPKVPLSPPGPGQLAPPRGRP
ncbi:MAG: hypothetical protein BWX88_01190 [Planctomycetes bacterium ADurb.Bin126]|nr:MAG: hypothetical protein BWX88_01190 [Planctomycetes bacterium ADurb.Bin126]HOD80764.1 hypothetical protein [Phycisphaerae bacterium]HQL71758.1 hypothetical protein [Phycisphaerae bacterium]